MQAEEPERRQRSEREREEESQAQQYDSFLYKFQQQIIDAWKPVPHTGSNVILYIILSAICLGLGLGLILSAPNYEDVYVRYDNACAVGATGCTVTLTVTTDLPAPVFFYYGFKGFYQNHRRYLKFFSSTQLSSGTVDASGLSTDCGDYVTNQQTFGAGNRSLATNVSLNDSANAFPCGTIASFYYKLLPELQSFALTDSTPIDMSQTGIAWPSDIGRHVNPSNLDLAGFSVTDERWLVWFRPAARSDFYKLDGIINQDLPAGNYTLTFDNRTRPLMKAVDATFGQKWVSLSKSNFVGNRDLFLGIAFLALGAGCLILLVVFLAKWLAEKRNRQKFE